MLIICVFWSALALLLACAALFIVPPVWLTDTAQLCRRTQITASGLLVSLLITSSFYIYNNLGSAMQLRAYYSADSIAKQLSAQQMRPLYARLQRELVRHQFDLQLDANNVALILNFAQIQSQAQQGVLDPSTKTLLNAVLKAIPLQVTALNLLAVHAYNTAEYAVAIGYWQQILQQITPDLRNTQVETVLRNKIAEAVAKSKHAKLQKN